MATCCALAPPMGFDALVTVDRSMEYRQNLARLLVPVIIMVARQNRLRESRPLVPQVAAFVSGGLRKRIYLVSD